MRSKHITEVITGHIPAFLQESNAASPYYINCGFCEDFALEIIETMGGETESLYALDLLNLAGSTSDPDSEMFDAGWLAENGYSLPDGVTVEQLNLRGWSHVFIVCEGKYYDAECPEGVTTPFALPLVINNLNCPLTRTTMPNGTSTAHNPSFP